MGILSFLGGAKTDKTTAKSKSTQEQLSEATQAKEQAKTSTGITSATGTTIEDVTKREDTTQQQAGTTTQTKGATGTQESVTSAFSEGALGTLESIFSQIGGKFDGSETDLASQLLGKVEGFDPEKFVSNLVSKTRSSIDRTLEPQLNQLASSVGGNANSAVALIRQQAEADAAGTLAGVEADATAQANQILTQNISAALGAQGQDQQLLALVGDLLKGGQTITTGAFTSEEEQAGEQESISRTIGTEESQAVGSQEQTQTQELTELINSLLKTNQKVSSTAETESEGTATTGGSLGGFLGNVQSFLNLGA